MDNGEAAPNTVYRWLERPKTLELEDRIKALEVTMGRVLTLAASVDSAGLTSVAERLARMARMEEVRKARRAESAPRGDMGDVGDGGRLTPCPVAGSGLGGLRGGSGGIGGGGACQE